MDKIKIDKLLGYLGKALTSFEIECFLNELKVKRRPFLKEEDIENSVYNKWLPIKKLGLELEFRNEENFLTLKDEKLGSSPLILTTLIFYSNKEDMRDYPYDLPNGLDFKNTPVEVRALFKETDCVLKSYIRDVFVCDTYQIIVSYDESRTKIDDITYMLISDEVEKEEKTELPSLETIMSLLGENKNSKKLRSTLNFFDLNDYIGERKQMFPYQLAKQLGITFSFSNDKEDGTGGNLYEIIFYNQGYLNFSKGYSGKLPCNLEFSLSPSEIISAVNEQPLFWEDSFLEGRARWIFNNYSLQVDYSVLMNYIAKVHIYPTWYWDDEFREDWEVNPYKVDSTESNNNIFKNTEETNVVNNNHLAPKTGKYQAILPSGHPQEQEIKLDPFAFHRYNKDDSYIYEDLEEYPLELISWVYLGE